MTDGRRRRSGNPDLEKVRVQIREQRRVILEARTVSVTLTSAMRDADAADAHLSDERRIELRAEWCGRAETLMLEVRVHAARSNRVAQQVTAMLRGSDVPDGLALLQRTIEEAGQAMDVASAAIATVRDARQLSLPPNQEGQPGKRPLIQSTTRPPAPASGEAVL